MSENRLGREKSPYLLQHAGNPVDWYPWGDEAFARARAEDRPIFLSVGYSTCHWCHVMAHESFESEEVARVLNRGFVPIKVDREERPDVDRIYMLFVQATTGGGGWPMSVFLTPDLKPFFGGTYFPPERRYQMPAFLEVLERIGEVWRTERDRVARSSEIVLEQLAALSSLGREAPSGPDLLDARLAERCFEALRRSYDPQHGGFGGAPKFPRPSVFRFLLRHHHRAAHDEGEGGALEMVVSTLRAIAEGGIRDHLGGGFHRYSVDEAWRVPHFEKMLYDQAQLALAALEAFQLAREPLLEEIARETLDYVLRDLASPEGGFFSAEDADSLDASSGPTPREREGAFYVWEAREIEEAVGQGAAAWLGERYGVRPGGNVELDPHGELAGKNVLRIDDEIEAIARRHDRPADEVARGIEQGRRALLAWRARRPRPHLDDKVLVSWNALTISALAKGAQLLGERRYLEAASRAAAFLLERMLDPSTGALRHRYRDGESAVDGQLDDHACLAAALCDLYETDFDPGRLEHAVRLVERMRELFEDREDGGFFSTPAGRGDLLLRLKDDHDGAEPSGNSSAVLALLRVAALTGRRDLARSAEAALRAFAPRLRTAPEALPLMAAGLLSSSAPPRQVILAGPRDADETIAMVARLHARFDPDRALLVVDDDTRERLAAFLPIVRDLAPREGRTTAWLCEGGACRLPVVGVEGLEELLDGGRER
jgi:uncharacterized protein